MEEINSQKVIEMIEEVLASGLAIKPVNRIRLKIEKFIPFWEQMKEEETATYFAEVILRRLLEIDNELESLPNGGGSKKTASGEKIKEPSFNPSPAVQKRFILQGPAVNQTDRATRGHYTKANFLRLLNNPLISLANSSTTLEYHLLRLRQTLLNTFHVLSIFHQVDCSDASLYSAIANMTIGQAGADPDDSTTLLQLWGNFIIAHALAKESSVPSPRDYESLLTCPFMHEEVSGYMSSEMLDTAVRLFVEHLPKFGQVSGYHHMNFGYGMYLTYMQICDACSITKPHASPFVMVSDLLAQDTELADQTVCCLLMFMKQLLGICVVPSDVLINTVKTLIPYRIWPLPVGEQASSLITAMNKELKFPGYHVRQSLNKMVSHLLQSKEDNRNIQMCRIFLNRDSYQGGMFHETLKRYHKYREAVLQSFGKDELVYTSLRLYLVNALSSDGHLDADTGMKILQGGIDNESIDLAEIQREVAKIEETAIEFPTIDKASLYRTEAMKKLLEEIMGKLNSMNSQTVSEIDMLPEFGPSFMIHEITNMHTSNCMEVLEGASGASGPRENKYPNTDAGIQLHKILLELSANSPSKSKFKGFGCRSLQIVVGGGDGTIHNFLKGFVFVHANYKDLIQKCGVDFKIYVLPLGVANRLSSFIAYYDSWYCGTVFTSLGNDLPLVPSAEMFNHNIETNAKEEKSGASHTIQHRMTMVLNKLNGHKLDSLASPNSSGRSHVSVDDDEESKVDVLKNIKAASIPSANITGHVLEKYLSVADERLQVSVFICEGWALQGKKTMHYTIPFCTQAYVGLPVHLATFGDKNLFQQLLQEHILEHMHQHASEGDPRPLNPPENCAQAFEQALLKYKLEVSLSFTQVDLQGNEVTNSVMSPSSGFSSLSLFNVPRSTDNGRICDPRSEWLDVSIAEYDTVYKSRKKVKSFDDLAFCAQMYHTNKLQIESLERHHTFSILLDGELYGPFYRVRITPCTLPHMRGENLKFPVMHHLPFQM